MTGSSGRTTTQSMTMGLLGGLALLAGVGMAALPFALPSSAPQPAQASGRYQIVAGPDGTFLRLDTATGRTWRLSSTSEVASAAGPRWVPIAVGE